MIGKDIRISVIFGPSKVMISEFPFYLLHILAFRHCARLSVSLFVSVHFINKSNPDFKVNLPQLETVNGKILSLSLDQSLGRT